MDPLVRSALAALPCASALSARSATADSPWGALVTQGAWSAPAAGVVYEVRRNTDATSVSPWLLRVGRFPA